MGFDWACCVQDQGKYSFTKPVVEGHFLVVIGYGSCVMCESKIPLVHKAAGEASMVLGDARVHP